MASNVYSSSVNRVTILNLVGVLNGLKDNASQELSQLYIRSLNVPIGLIGSSVRYHLWMMWFLRDDGMCFFCILETARTLWVAYLGRIFFFFFCSKNVRLISIRYVPSPRSNDIVHLASVPKCHAGEQMQFGPDMSFLQFPTLITEVYRCRLEENQCS